MIVGIVCAVLAASLLIAVVTGRGRRRGGIAEFLVGGRTFPAWLVYFLAVGEVYSIGTMIGLPSGIYAKGAGYGIWFLGYILLAYVIGYFVAPLIWRAGHRYDAMTLPDVFRGHYRSRTLELVAAVTMLIALIPWGEYQFIGLQVVLGSLGIRLTGAQTVAIAAVLAFLYIAVSGIRSPAMVSIMKDSFMVLGVVAVGVAALLCSHGAATTPISTTAIPAELATVHGSAMTFAITTIAFQAVVFYLGLGSSYIFPARSERAIKSSTVWMPLYMLIYPFLVAASYFALRAYPHVAEPNTIFMVTARNVLPSWLVGVVAAGAALSGLLVLAVTALGIGALVSRNLLPHVQPAVQRRWTTVFVAIFLVLAALMTLYAATLMLTVLNLFYGLVAQVVPGILAVLYTRRVHSIAITTGIVAGVVAAVVLYLHGPSLAGVNSGLIAMGINMAVVVGWWLISPGPTRQPIARASGTGGEPQEETDLAVGAT